MKCKDCEYFRIAYEPLGKGKNKMDWGRAECTKHNLITDFRNHGKFERLKCIEGEKTDVKM